jgi:trans-aconitate methyltransferase
MRYTFGTTKKAADRLGNIASFFNPLAGEFITNHINREIETALDLGCGPGFTTDMIYRALKCKKVYGFDNSKEMLEYAKNILNTAALYYMTSRTFLSQLSQTLCMYDFYFPI